jgi:hypothetical protein
MNEQKIKKELINQVVLDLTIKGEVLKSQNVISDYDVKTDIGNLSVAPDGELEYDVIISQTILPKKSMEYINLNFKII